MVTTYGSLHRRPAPRGGADGGPGRAPAYLHRGLCWFHCRVAGERTGGGPRTRCSPPVPARAWAQRCSHPPRSSIITATYEGAQRTRALSAWGGSAAGGAAAGVLLGGILTSLFGWQTIFLVNVPIGLTLPRSRSAQCRPRRRRCDAARARPARRPDGRRRLGLLVYAIEGADRRGWGSAETLGLGAGAAILLFAFALIERRSRHALVPSATWRNRSLVASATVMLGAPGCSSVPSSSTRCSFRMRSG